MSARGRWMWVGAAALLLAAVCAAWLHYVSPVRGLPYADAFGKGKADEWSAFGGTWELAGGAMRNDSDERGAKLLTGSPRWRDYSIEADIMLYGRSGDAGLLIRSSGAEEGVDAYHGYYAGLRTLDNALTIGRADYGWSEVNFPLAQHGITVQSSRWYHLRLMAVGCRIAASLQVVGSSERAVASIDDPECIRAGRAGLRSYSSGGVWKNVRIRSTGLRDMSELLSRTPSYGPPGTQPAASNPSNFPVSQIAPMEDQPKPLPSSQATQPISSLRVAPFDARNAATIRGIVTLVSPRLFVQDATGGAAVQLAIMQPLKVGDEVEVTGSIHANGFSTTLRDATARVLWESTPVPATSLTAAQVATGAYDATWIELSGRLRGKEAGAANTMVLKFDSGSQSFYAIMNRGRGNLLYGRLKPGSMLRMRGVAVTDATFTGDAVPFAVLVRSSDDFEVLAGPPWWNAGHLITIAACLLPLAFAANFLYHRVESLRLRAVVKEREHLAYEMHDTLAQSVAGIGFQLEAIRIGMPEELTQVHRQLDLASELVRHSHAEARRSIDMLRPQELNSQGLLHALQHTAERLVKGGGVRVVARTVGEPRSIPLRVTDTLYRLGQEAIANAVRHAHPATISICVEYLRSGVRLTVADDGTGFASEAKAYGFGVQGMRKRAASISAQFAIVSREGDGTEVTVTAPLAPRFTLALWSRRTRTFSEEGSSYVAGNRGDSHPDRG